MLEPKDNKMCTEFKTKALHIAPKALAINNG